LSRLFQLPRRETIEALVTAFPRPKKQKTEKISTKADLSAKNALLPVTSRPSFELHIGSAIWEFHCCEEGPNAAAWMGALDGAIETLSVNALLDQQLAQHAVPTGLVIMSATYGKIDEQQYRVDVTSVCSDLVRQQGGAQLNLGTESKRRYFGDPAPHKKKLKLQLTLVYSVNGEVKTQTFGDGETVSIAS